MHILFTNHNLDVYTGTGTFVHTLAVLFRAAGHEVTCYSPTVGVLGRRLEEADVVCVSSLRAVTRRVDVIHAHHRHETLLAALHFPGVPLIAVIHGVLPWQEQPSGARLGIHRYVAVSEEVQDHLATAHGLRPPDVVLLRNGIDLARFRARTPVALRPRQALALSNYMRPDEVAVLTEACAHEGIALRVVGTIGEPVWAVENAINEADLVFTLGRGALEAMACERLTFVYDYNGADGMITPANFHLLRRRNFSGRTFAYRYRSAAALAAELRHYDPGAPRCLYAEIARDHDAGEIARQYLALYREAIASPAVGADPAVAIAELIAENARLQVALGAERAGVRKLSSGRALRLVAAYWRLREWVRRASRT